MVAKVRPSKRSGVWTVCPAALSSSANAWKPAVWPCAEWNRTTTAIASGVVGGGDVGGQAGVVDEEPPVGDQRAAVGGGVQPRQHPRRDGRAGHVGRLGLRERLLDEEL